MARAEVDRRAVLDNFMIALPKKLDPRSRSLS